MRLHALTGLLAGVTLSLLPSTANRPVPTHLEQVVAAGELRVVTRNTATTYYEGPDGPTGLEYELARGFAQELGVRLELVSAANVSEVMALLERGAADLAAAGLTATEPRRQRFRFTPPYHHVKQQLVYRLDTRRPKDLDDLSGLLEVIAESSHAERLRTLQGTYARLSWLENRELSSEELLTLVSERLVDFTIADSTEVALNQAYYPELRVAFDIGDPQPLAWAFRQGRDSSLYDAASAYFERLKADGRLSQLIGRHLEHAGNLDYVGSRVFRRHILTRLPQYRETFEQAGRETGLDWLLLAAVGYQESHWDPNAVSHTGVKGLMQLTKSTAKKLGVKSRTDPTESILGGSRYLRKLIDAMPERIQEPDRSWLALAAYNVGIAHLEDARKITLKRGGDPDRWEDVKESLPLLRNPKWFEKTRYGYARGNEAALFVENVRTYHKLLAWIVNERDEPREPQTPTPALLVASPVL